MTSPAERDALVKKLRDYADALDNVLPMTDTARLLDEAADAPSESSPETVVVPSVYVASRTNRAQMWQEFRSEGYPIISSWIDEAGEGETLDFSELWQRIYGEIKDSRGVLFYANPEDAPWKGAFIEVGIALGMGKPVCVVIDGELEGRTMRPVGSWIAHPKVSKHDSLREAFTELLAASPGAQKGES